ncbi:50S ribosomal protein L10 [Brumimicrobium aurantiacum]|uniref:Large ribosomal subunit protein uL10 n=1 Tax=Brumimicrobium aurantiacum TaxID=1737063 RepID=A0A3E1EY30_9FLAO|nr:50S ribosomal protein L10 [Brumimicrobium aurantiacum]RFC54461.1 50S ribosomal protein L10 [Brumimicrobium aurantiacum]
MNREEKAQYIDDLTAELKDAGIFYLADTSELTVEAINDLRGKCFKNGVSLRVIKNTLFAKAIERIEDRDLGELKDVLSGPTSIMFAEVGNAPAKIIKDFRKKHDKPILKAAYVEETIYVGDENLNTLVEIKSKDELIGDIVTLLQSPAKNVVSGLKGQGGKIAGILKTLEERA